MFRIFAYCAQFFMNIVTAMSWPWFGPISNNSSWHSQRELMMDVKTHSFSTVVNEFGFTLDEINWLGNIICLMYLPIALAVPIVVSRYGIRRCVSYF
jgi:FLVCR family MFS transporter 7